jgi:hypothetical protein
VQEDGISQETRQQLSAKGHTITVAILTTLLLLLLCRKMASAKKQGSSCQRRATP